MNLNDLGTIYLVGDDGDLVSLSETPYDSEDLLQRLLARYPSLLAGEQVNPSEPRRWMLVQREAGIPGDEGGGNRWSVDHLSLDQDGVPTLVEVKRSRDTRIRREVVGQMLDYAANALGHWPLDTVRTLFERSADERGEAAGDVLAAAGIDDEEEFWRGVKTNLQAGRVRLVFVADRIPTELARVIEFLNEQMDPAEVIGIEVRQFVGAGRQTLVPRVVGQTAQAQQKSRRRRPPSGSGTRRRSSTRCANDPARPRWPSRARSSTGVMREACASGGERARSTARSSRCSKSAVSHHRQSRRHSTRLRGGVPVITSAVRCCVGLAFMAALSDAGLAQAGGGDGPMPRSALFRPADARDVASRAQLLLRSLENDGDRARPVDVQEDVATLEQLVLETVELTADTSWALYALASAEHLGFDVSPEVLDVAADRAACHSAQIVAAGLRAGVPAVAAGEHPCDTDDCAADDALLWHGLWALRHRATCCEGRDAWVAWRNEARDVVSRPLTDTRRSEVAVEFVTRLLEGRAVGASDAAAVSGDLGTVALPAGRAPLETRLERGTFVGLAREVQDDAPHAVALSLLTMAVCGLGQPGLSTFGDFQDLLDDVLRSVDAEGVSHDVQLRSWQLLALVEATGHLDAGDCECRMTDVQLARDACAVDIAAGLGWGRRQSRADWALLDLALHDEDATLLNERHARTTWATMPDGPAMNVIGRMYSFISREETAPVAFGADSRSWRDAFWIGAAAIMHSAEAEQEWVKALYAAGGDEPPTRTGDEDAAAWQEIAFWELCHALSVRTRCVLYDALIALREA